jgi:hypothetical protein
MVQFCQPPDSANVVVEPTDSDVWAVAEVVVAVEAACGAFNPVHSARDVKALVTTVTDRSQSRAAALCTLASVAIPRSTREVRKHAPGCGSGAAGEPERGYEYLRSVHAEVTAAVFAALDDQRRSLPEQLAAEALKSAVSIVPVVRDAVQMTPTVAEAVIESRRFERSWIAARMRLRDRT